MLHSHLLGVIHAKDYIQQQEDSVATGILGGTVRLFNIEGEVREVIDDNTIDSILEDAGVDSKYVAEIQDEMEGMLTDRAKLDFYDNMKSLRSVLAQNVPTGLGYRDFLDKLGREKSMASIGLAGESPYYIENVYRTNYGTAHSAGRWKAAQESPLVTLLKYVSVLDGRTTEDICEPLNGTVRKKTDAFWSTYMPINHFS